MFNVPENPSDGIKHLATFAIDVSGAYTDAARGTGLAFASGVKEQIESHTLPQTEAIGQIVKRLEALRGNNVDAVNLVLEAPLSYAVAASASSDARLRAIEKPASYPKLRLHESRVRPWNCNAGASTALMALLFLSDLHKRAPKDVKINLFEGFWSWGSALDKPKTHSEVAKHLLQSLRSGSKAVKPLPRGQTAYRTALELLSIDVPSASVPPLIVFGHPKLAEAYTPQG